MKVFRNTSKITGALKDANGKVITGVPARVFASAKTDIWKEAFVEPLTGIYTMGVASGTWYLGYDIDPKFGYIAVGHDIEVRVGENVTVTKDLFAERAGSTLSGQVVDTSGNGVLDAFVEVSKSSFSGEFENGEFASFVAGAETDTNGFYKIAL